MIDKEVLDALRGRTGTREVRFRYDILRAGAVVKAVSAQGSISLDTESTIQRTGRFTLLEEIDWMRDEIRPVMLLRLPDAEVKNTIYLMPCGVFDALDLTADAFDALNITAADIDAGFVLIGKRTTRWTEFPLGVFVPSTPTRSSAGGADEWAVEAYDRTVILREDCLIAPLYYAAGTSYLEAINDILLSAGVSNVINDTSDMVLANDREFEVGASKLDITNALLAEMNFNPVRCDAQGTFLLTRYVEPSAGQVTHTYAADELSVIARDTSSEYDAYRIPNVFIAVCSNPELDQDYRSVWHNDNPASRLSTAYRGRVIVSEIYQPDSITSQEALDDYIRRIGQEATLRGYERFTFTTALMPIHGSGDVVNILHPDTAGTYAESSWSMDLSAEGEMSHVARRLVLL